MIRSGKASYPVLLAIVLLAGASQIGANGTGKEEAGSTGWELVPLTDFRLQTRPSYVYSVVFASRVDSAAWSSEGTVNGTGRIEELDLDAPTGDRGFYRLLESPIF